MNLYRHIPPNLIHDPSVFLVFDKDGTITPSNAMLQPLMASRLSQISHHRLIVILTARSIATCHDQLIGGLSQYDYKKEHMIFACSNGAEIYTYAPETDTYTMKQKLDGCVQEEYFLSAVQYLRDSCGEQHVFFEKRSDTMGVIVFLPRDVSAQERNNFDPDQSKRRGYIEKIRPLFQRDAYEFYAGGATSIDIALYSKEQ